MVAIHRPEARKCLRIVADNLATHFHSHRSLPRIIFSHPVGRSALKERDSGSMSVMQPLPAETAQELAHRVDVIGTFQDFRHTRRANPKSHMAVPGQPSARRAGFRRSEFVEEVDQEGRIQQRIHGLFRMASRLSPMSESISASRSAAVVNGRS